MKKNVSDFLAMFLIFSSFYSSVNEETPSKDTNILSKSKKKTEKVLQIFTKCHIVISFKAAGYGSGSGIGCRCTFTIKAFS